VPKGREAQESTNSWTLHRQANKKRRSIIIRIIKIIIIINHTSRTLYTLPTIHTQHTAHIHKDVAALNRQPHHTHTRTLATTRRPGRGEFKRKTSLTTPHRRRANPKHARKTKIETILTGARNTRIPPDTRPAVLRPPMTSGRGKLDTPRS
jgi:hypothetical protein